MGQKNIITKPQRCNTAFWGTSIKLERERVDYQMSKKNKIQILHDLK